MRKFNGKIDAIKALRELISQGKVIAMQNENGTYTFKPENIGLKEAKDFIEGVLNINLAPYQPTVWVNVHQDSLGNITTTYHRTRPVETYNSKSFEVYLLA